MPEAREGYRAVSGEGVEHSRVGGDGSDTAEELRSDHDQYQQFTDHLTRGVGEDVAPRDSARKLRIARVLRSGDGDRETVYEVRDGDAHADQKNEPSDPGDPDRGHNSFGTGDRGVQRLFGHVGRCVIPSEGVLGDQQSKKEDVERNSKPRQSLERVEALRSKEETSALV